MQTLLRVTRRRIGSFQPVRRIYTLTEKDEAPFRYPEHIGGSHYQEGDRLLVIRKDGSKVKSKLMAPLSPDDTTIIGSDSYRLKHSDIIGKPAGRLYVQASQGRGDKSTTLRITHPSLEQFIAYAPRSVTPIYSSYGATIVTLLDIHVAPPSKDNNPETSGTPPLEILEAGTGNGGLTLHLARSIAAANPRPPHFKEGINDVENANRWSEWRSKRRAIIHTVEFHNNRSRVAERLIRSFRGALYWPHVDFHSGDVGLWVKEELQKRKQNNGGDTGFLDIVILDLPNVHSHIQDINGGLKEDGQLLVWVPQITQVAACQQQIESLNLPLKLDQVVELGEGISNGRRWDVRFIKPRAEQKKDQIQPSSDGSVVSQQSESDVDESEGIAPTIEADNHQSAVHFPTMVCRPMVGELIMGGGFVGLWRKVHKPLRKNPDTVDQSSFGIRDRMM